MYKGQVKCYPVRSSSSHPMSDYMGDYVGVGDALTVLTPAGVTQAGGIQTTMPMLQATAVLDPNMGKAPSMLPKIALIGAVGVGGYLLYKHFKKGR